MAIVQDLTAVKLEDSWYSLFILGIFCGLLMYIAVETVKRSHDHYNTLSTVLPIICVSTFIIAGFEHCIADMFYFAVAGLTFESLRVLFFVTIGNILGSFIVPAVNLCTLQRSK